MENNFNEFAEANFADGTPSDFAASAPEHGVEYGRDPMVPVYPGPVITAPPVSGAPVVVPLPLQYPLNPQQYPAYYELPMQYPYPMRGYDAQGNEVEFRFVPLPVPLPVPGPFFYPPRPFIFPIPPVPPFFI